MEYPQIFITGIIPPDMSSPHLLAEGLMAWGTCHMGVKPLPAKFGEVLVQIGERLGCSGDGDSLMTRSKEFRAAGSPLDFFENPIYKKPKDGRSKFEQLVQASEDVIAAHRDVTQHGDPMEKLSGCILALFKVLNPE